MRGAAAAATVLCVGVLDGLERVCALALLLPEISARVAVCKVEALLLTVERFHKHGELLALRGDEFELLGGGGVGHGSGVQAAGGGEGFGLHVAGAGHGGRSSGDGCNGAREHAVKVGGGGDDGAAGGGDGEAGEEVLGVGGRGCIGSCGLGAAGCRSTA